MDQKLNAAERRVLGALMEKSMTQPDYYPMTLNAIVTACNQKSNRDPVMELDDETIWDTLETLRLRGLVGKILAAPGSRVDRFRHDVDKTWGWEKPQRAIMTELLLRGPQTVGELRTRCSRMYAFQDLATVSAVLESLITLESPVVEPLPRVPGQSTIRYTHLLYPEEEQLQSATASSSNTADKVATPATAIDPDETQRLTEQVQTLENQVTELYETVADLARRLDTLEGR